MFALVYFTGTRDLTGAPWLTLAAVGSRQGSRLSGWNSQFEQLAAVDVGRQALVYTSHLHKLGHEQAGL